MTASAPPAPSLPPRQGSADIHAALRAAGFAALIAAGLGFPVVLYRTDRGFLNELVLRSRWDAAALLCVAAALLAFARRLGLWRGEAEGGYAAGTRAGLVIGVPALLFALLALPPALLDIAQGIAPGQALAAAAGGFARPAVLLPLAALILLAAQAYLWPFLGRARAAGAGSAPRLSNLAPLLLGVALGYPLLVVLAKGGLSESRYLVDLGILILTYVMLGWGLNIVVGLAGLLDLGYVAFFAVGAYTFALLSSLEPVQAFFAAHLGDEFWRLWGFWVCLPLAGLLAALWGILLGFPVLRLRGDYLAVVTLAFGEIIRAVLVNWTEVTRGNAGISSLPRATFFGVPFSADETGFAARFGLAFDPMHRMVFLYYLILALALVTNLVTLRLRRLPIGRAWEALREDEIAARSLGLDITKTKLTAFALGAMFGGFAGCFFAVRQGFINPESFTFLESAIILAIVVLGGMGSQVGVALAAVAMVGGPELLRNLGVLKQVFGEEFDPSPYRLLLFGLAMVAVMVWRPRGLVGERDPSIILKERKRIAGSLVAQGRG